MPWDIPGVGNTPKVINYDWRERSNSEHRGAGGRALGLERRVQVALLVLALVAVVPYREKSNCLKIL